MTTLVCPECASGKVVIDEDSNKADCQDCGWVGVPKNLISVPMPLSGESLAIDPDRALEIARKMSERYMELLYKVAAKPIGNCIFNVGLVGRKDTEGLTRLLRAACKGAHKATLEEAENISKERSGSKILS
jgi:hypothetical protein